MQAYEVDLPIYEGPMDLLLALVAKNKIDIHDIPIHQITDQYLDYLARAQALDLELASSFFTMAAQLLLIKSRMLLPRRPEPEPEAEDPREELARSLEAFKKMKDMKARIEKLLAEEAPYHGKEPEPVKGGPYEGPISLARLRAAFRAVYEERREEEARLLPAEEVTLSEETARWMAALSAGRVELTAWLRARASRLQLVVSFMALLELIRLGEAVVKDSAEGLVIEGT